MSRIPFPAEIRMAARFRIAQEQAFELRLLAFQIEFFSAIQPVLQLHAVNQDRMNQIGDLVSHGTRSAARRG